jgi:hypothetical protein
VLIKWMKYDLIALDEAEYSPLTEIAAEFLFQVIAERAEKAAHIRRKASRRVNAGAGARWASNGGCRRVNGPVRLSAGGKVIDRQCSGNPQ